MIMRCWKIFPYLKLEKINQKFDILNDLFVIPFNYI